MNLAKIFFVFVFIFFLFLFSREKKEAIDYEEFIDLHVHVGPELWPRKYDTRSLVEEEKGKIRAMAVKNHLYPTSPWIDWDSDPMLIGSITLNNYIGGLNVDAIYASAKLSPRPILVWFPTINSETFLEESEYEIPPEWTGGIFISRLSEEIKPVLVSEQGKLTEEAIDVLKAIADNKAILVTGHISWLESVLLVEKAKEVGIEKIIITHPIYQHIDMPVNVQKRLAEIEGVYLEQNYAMYLIDKIPIERIADQIKEVGAEKIILSSDMGQVGNPSPSKGVKLFAELLIEQGITKEEIETMAIRNPGRIVGII